MAAGDQQCAAGDLAERNIELRPAILPGDRKAKLGESLVDIRLQDDRKNLIKLQDIVVIVQ